MAEFDVALRSTQDAAAFLKAFLEVREPTLDLTPGSPNYQVMVKGNAYPVAFLRDAIEKVRQEASLLNLVGAVDTPDVADMADALLANLLISRTAGKFARGIALLKFSTRTDQRVPLATRLFRTSALVYYPDYTSDVIISASDLRVFTGDSGQVLYYTYPINVKAARTGADYNQDAGSFDGVDQFSPYLLGADNPSPLVDGTDVQSTASAIDAASDAMANRALGNARSNSVVLRQNFSVDQVLSIGHGDREMVRDVLVSSVGRLHMGGAADLYVRSPTREVVLRRTIGAAVPRADDRAVVFRDTVPPGGLAFTNNTVNVRPGDVLFIQSGIPEAPIQYRLDVVRDNEVEISIRTPFSVVTDEGDPAQFVYSIGNNYPLFNNKVDVVSPTSTAATSRAISTPGRVTLNGGAVYAISKVEMLTVPPALAAFADSTTGRVPFLQRQNQPFLGPTSGTLFLPYRVVVLNPAESQSSRSLTQLDLIWPSADYDGYVVEITYTTLADFDAIAGYVENRENRPDPADYLARGFHPVYVSFTIPYSLRVDSSATSRLGRLLAASPVFDAARAASQLTRYISTYQAQDPIDASGLVTQLRFTTDVTLATIYSFQVQYELLGPDGGVYRYSTTDKVTIFPDATSGAVLLNPADFGLPTTGYETALRRRLQLQGVSDRNIRFIAAPGAINFQSRV